MIGRPCYNQTKSGQNTCFILAVLCVLATSASFLLLTPHAFAQDASVGASAKDSRKGLFVGALQLKPGIFLEGGYDSNVFSEDEQEGVESAPLLNLRLKMGVVTPKPKGVAFELEAGMNYSNYFSDSNQVTEQNGVSLDALGALIFNPNGAFAVRVFDAFQRTNEPTTAASFESLNRFSNEVGGSLKIQPGGKLLTAELGGSYSIFRNDTELSDLDHDRVKLNGQLKWKFLPKTAFLVITDKSFVNYAQTERTVKAGDSEVLEGADGALENSNSGPFRIQGGINGLWFSKISVTALVGYGNGFYDAGENFSGVIGRGELGYEIASNARARVGYQRDFQDSPFGNFATFHNIFARYNHQFAGAFDFKLEGSYKLVEYATVENQTLPNVSVNGVPGASLFSTENRVDPLWTLETSGVFRVYDIWRVGARYKLNVNNTDFFQITDQVVPSSYTKHQVFATTGVEW